MDFQKLFNNLCNNATLYQMDIRTLSETNCYIQGVFDTMNALGLTDVYNDWCRENDIVVLDDNRLYN